jgi:hypothetical protein
LDSDGKDASRGRSFGEQGRREATRTGQCGNPTWAHGWAVGDADKGQQRWWSGFEAALAELGEPITTAGLKTRRGGYGFCDIVSSLLAGTELGIIDGGFSIGFSGNQLDGCLGNDVCDVCV